MNCAVWYCCVEYTKMRNCVYSVSVKSRGEREFPFPVIPGNTCLKFPVPSLPVAFQIFPSRSREKEVLDGN